MIRMFDRTVHQVTKTIEGIFIGNINMHRAIPMKNECTANNHHQYIQIRNKI